MKKFFLLSILFVKAICLVAQTNSDYKILLNNFKQAHTTPAVSNWPMDANGNMYCALVRVNIGNFSAEDISKIYFAFDQNTPLVKQETIAEGGKTVLYLFVTPTDDGTFIEAGIDGYGKSNRESIAKLKEKKCYDVSLVNNKKVSVSFNTTPEGAVVRLENSKRITTPGVAQNMVTGRHFITITYNNKTLVYDTIMVTDKNVDFDYDLRTKKDVTFTSTPSNIPLYIDDKYVGRTPLTRKLSYASYKVEAKKSENETDTRTINVSDYSETEVKMVPTEKKTLNVYATYQGRRVKALLNIDDELYNKEAAESYRLTLPYGRKYAMEMTYSGNSKKRNVKIKKGMSDYVEFVITDRKKITWPWQRVYDARPIGLSVSYVNKQWTAKEGNVDFSGVLPWQLYGYDAEGASLHGIQAGIHMQPCFYWGGGLYTGLFFEFYTSSQDAGEISEIKSNVFDSYQELDLYIPLHLYYRLPMSEIAAISFHAGFGFDIGLYNRMTASENDNKEPYENFYGEDAVGPYDNEGYQITTGGYPNRFNVSADIGIGIRFAAFQINAQYSKGLTKNGCIMGNNVEIDAKQNKFSIGLSYLIPGDY